MVAFLTSVPSNAIEIAMALQDPEKEQSIGYCETRNPHVETLLLLPVFLPQIFKLALRLFGCLPHLPHIVVRAQNLLSLRRQLVQHVARGLVGLIEVFRRVFQHLGLIRSIENRRLIARCNGGAAFLIRTDCVRPARR